MNVAVTSEARISISSTLIYEQDPTHCEVFPDEIGPLKHSHELVPAKFKCDVCDSIFSTKSACSIQKNIHNKVGFFVCKVCSCHFILKLCYIKHMNKRHGVISIKQFKLIPPDYECNYCECILRSNKQYNYHVLASHPVMYSKVIDKDFEEYVSRANNLKGKNKKRKGKKGKNKTIESDDVIEHKLSMKTEHIHFAIPISTLFECNKCKTHFISCSVAIEHEKRCVLKKGDWTCMYCYRSFKKADRSTHLQQHKLTDRFKVIEVKDDILYRLLYKCIECLVCYNEKSLLKYHGKVCSDSSPNCIFCTGCKSPIHKYMYDDHRRNHNELGVNFIIVEIVCAEQMQTNNFLKKVQEVKPEVDYAPLSRSEKTFFYCKICQVYIKSEVKPHGIKCSIINGTSLCDLCGLRFTTRSFNSHKQKHQKLHNLKLHNLIFFDVLTKKKINPPFPNFKKCTSCNVNFFTYISLKNHICRCSAKEARSCRYCGEKFNDFTYKLHVPFHEYVDIQSKKKEESQKDEDIQKEDEIQYNKKPKIIKKYGRLKTISNILFQCDTCDTVLDFYDDVVEHCQDHSSNRESHNTTKNLCSICDLHFAGHCYEKHKKLHAISSINKSAFKILVYKHENLLSESWTDIFDSLSKEQVDQILNGSKYKNDRSVRIKDEIDIR